MHFLSTIPEIEKRYLKLWAPKLCQKLWKIEHEKVLDPQKPHRKDITMLKKWFISAFPQIENISQTLAPKLCKIYEKIELLMKMGIRSAKTHRAVFRFFARYYDAEEVIHKRISWDWEDISNSGSKAMPKIMKNWTFNEKEYRIRKTSQERFSPFCKILQCWRSDSSAHFLKSRRYLKLWPQSYAKNYKKMNI